MSGDWESGIEEKIAKIVVTDVHVMEDVEGEDLIEVERKKEQARLAELGRERQKRDEENRIRRCVWRTIAPQPCYCYCYPPSEKSSPY